MFAQLFEGDCLAVLETFAANSLDSIVTDAPYGLSEHSPADVLTCLTAWINGREYRHGKPGFMGRSWDSWVPGPEVWRACLHVLKPGGHLLCFAGTRSMDLMCLAIRLAGFELRDAIGWAHDGTQAPLLAWMHGQGMPKGLDLAKAVAKAGGDADEVATFAGWNTSLKPAWEPILLARKPLIGTVAANARCWATGGMNIDATRLPADPGGSDDPRLGGRGNTGAMAKPAYGSFAGRDVGSDPQGRWPANVIQDGSDTVLAAFAAFGEKTSGMPGTRRKAHTTHSMSGQLSQLGRPEVGYADRGSASRFFYCAKASAKDRQGSRHNTVKPLALLRYLCRLVTPPGGVVLDPFAGSGTTGEAALDAGFNAILIEREAEYCADIRRRLARFLDPASTPTDAGMPQ